MKTWFFAQQIFELIEICGALSHIHAVTGLRFFLQLLYVQEYQKDCNRIEPYHMNVNYVE